MTTPDDYEARADRLEYDSGSPEILAGAPDAPVPDLTEAMGVWKAAEQACCDTCDASLGRYSAENDAMADLAAARVIATALADRDAQIAKLREGLKASHDAAAEYYRYWTGGETRGSYDGKPERNGLWKAMYGARAILKENPNG